MRWQVEVGTLEKGHLGLWTARTVSLELEEPTAERIKAETLGLVACLLADKVGLIPHETTRIYASVVPMTTGK